MKPKHTRQSTLPFHWPEPSLQVALIEPEIPPNTGNIARLCAATGTRLHLVGRLGFRLNDAKLRRAGLDYWDAVDLERHSDLAALFQRVARPLAIFQHAGRHQLCFGQLPARRHAGVRVPRPRGLPEELLDQAPRTGHSASPLRNDRVRSLNLANAVAIVLYEALSQFQTPDDRHQTTDNGRQTADPRRQKAKSQQAEQKRTRRRNITRSTSKN